MNLTPTSPRLWVVSLNLPSAGYWKWPSQSSHQSADRQNLSEKGVGGPRVYWLGLNVVSARTSVLRPIDLMPTLSPRLRGVFESRTRLGATHTPGIWDFVSPRSALLPPLSLTRVLGLSSVEFSRTVTLMSRYSLPSSLALYGEKNKLRGLLLVSRLALVGEGYSGASQEVLTEVSVTSVAAMFGYSRRYQRAHFLRLSFIKHLRRYLLTLGQLEGSLGVVGAIRQFRGYFKALNSPTNQIFWHPLTSQYVADVGLAPSAGLNAPYSRGDLTHMVQSNLKEHQVLVGESPVAHQQEGLLLNTDVIVTDLVNFFWRYWRHTSFSGTLGVEVVHRYRLSWDRVFFTKGAEHGFKRVKRARSIKKRRAKRLVQKTKYRFWSA